ncbi:MAG TPA: hypothetical protein VGQ83_41090 [Polyangia bacterium]|jgi:hypothetical protein
MATVTGPDVRPLMITMAVEQKGSDVTFGEPVEDEGLILSLLPGWGAPQG